MTEPTLHERRIDALCNAYVDDFCALDPLTATSVGVAGHEHEMTDYSPAGFDARDAFLERTRLEIELEEAGVNRSRMSVLWSPLHEIRGVFDLMPTEGEEAVAAIAARLAAVPSALEGLRVTLSDEARTAVKTRVKAVRAERDAQVAARSRPLTGLSEFPNLDEVLPEREHLPHRYARHYGWAYEDMRAAPATRPVFLATMGTVAAHTARATFASNLLAAGGVAVEAAGATSDVDAVTAAYAGQPVVCLAGTDAAYAAWGADLVAALRAAGASYVVLAGKPGEKTGLRHGDADDAVDDWAAMGVDALGFLGRIREELSK